MRQKRLPQKLNRRKRGEDIRDAIVRLLKLHHELSVQSICEMLGVTDTAVRRHVAELKGNSLITSRLEERETGRPISIYSLTEASRQYLPSGFEELANSMLDTVYDTGGHRGVLDFVLANNEHLIQAYYVQFSVLTLEERVATIANYFVANGYMTAWLKQPDGSFFLYHQNCAIFSLAKRFRQFCLAELVFIERLLDAKVSRSHYIFKDDQPVCGYVISKKTLNKVVETGSTRARLSGKSDPENSGDGSANSSYV